MSNPQLRLLNHGNIYGTISFSSESKCFIYCGLYFVKQLTADQSMLDKGLFESVKFIFSLLLIC